MFPHTFAQSLAEDFLSDISPLCQRAEIVGSLRRQRPHVHDIDILAIPCVIKIPDHSLFGAPVKENLLDLKLSNLCRTNYFAIDISGPRLKRLFREEWGETLPIDLYIASEETWPTLMLVRTGSRSHNIKLAIRAQELGLKLKADGTGLMTPDGTAILVKSEEDIFEHLRLPYRPPQERE